jgi:hypothetical protein
MQTLRNALDQDEDVQGYESEQSDEDPNRPPDACSLQSALCARGLLDRVQEAVSDAELVVFCVRFWHVPKLFGGGTERKETRRF